MTHHEVEKFSAGARWFHWVITAAALALAITGLFLYVPAFAGAAEGSYSRIIHRVAAVIFVAAPLLFFLVKPGGSLRFIKQIFSWGKDDLAWLKAAPDYYFGGSEKNMPPQPEMNTGQKLWGLVAFLSALGFIITGIFMWFLKDGLPAGVFNWMVVVHDVCFIAGGAMVLVHLYLGAIHPRMTESLKSMIGGKVSVEYAKSHHGKWYNEIAKVAEVGKPAEGAEPAKVAEGTPSGQGDK
jgi:formate dehydrogenase subunit gamma